MSQFQPGQVWTYHTRTGEDDSRLTIARVEAHEKLGTIVHIRVDGVAQKNPHVPAGVSRVIHHMPFAEEALARSVIELVVSEGLVPASYEDGHRIWKEEFDKGKAGVFTLTVAESIQFCEDGLKRLKV